MSNEEDEEIIREFLEESSDLLDELDREFIALEKEPDSVERLATIFRAAHTIKGTSGLLGFGKLESVTHVGENVLAKLRDGKLVLTPAITSSLLCMVDAIREILDCLGQSGSEGDTDYSSLVDELGGILAEAQEQPPTPNGGTKEPGRSFQAASVPPTKGELATASTAAREIPVAAREASPAAREIPAAREKRSDTSLARSQSMGPEEASPRTGHVMPRETNVRVGVGLLDRLMNLVGELVLARNQVLQCASRLEEPTLVAASQRLNLITTELQEGVMKTRMQAIGSVWSKFPRIVRDLAVTCGKNVVLETEGEDTELDRTVIEAIRDPLTHIVRNAVDHGIETEEEREKIGKPRAGTISFRAFHEGGMVNIEIIDDGKGLDTSALRAKAVERGLLTPERAAHLSDRESIQLLFLPGFSTAKEVTKVSGRGVGMDVVRTSIEKIGGTVDIQSKLGEGTSIRVKIPLTLAIIPALVVRSGKHRYAIPQVSLVELVRVEAERALSAVEFIRDTAVYRLRGRLLPLVFLSDVLGRTKARDASFDELNIVVLQADDRSFGLVVDAVHDTQEIVVKPLGRELKGIAAFAGATIMGDGRVALILDVFGIAEAAGMQVAIEHENSLSKQEELALEKDDGAQALLVFQADDRSRMAVPLDSVDRLEEFSVAALEMAGGRRVIQYRERILPLVHANEVLGGPVPKNDSENLHVVVHSRGARSVGLIVGTISDIVHDRVQFHGVARRGVLGSGVVQGKVTELFDLNCVWALCGGLEREVA